MSADQIFARGKVYVTLSASSLSFAARESRKLGMNRSRLIEHALAYYRDHVEEGRQLAAPVPPPVTKALLAELHTKPMEKRHVTLEMHMACVDRVGLKCGILGTERFNQFRAEQLEMHSRQP